MKKIAILGASGHGKVVADIAELSGFSVDFFDDRYPQVQRLERWPVVGCSEELSVRKDEYESVIVAIGDNLIRKQKIDWLNEIAMPLATLVHPNANVSNYANIGSGTVVMAGAMINPFTDVGVGCIVNTGATIDHDCSIADFCHISPGANLAGTVKVEKLSWVGIGATVKQCVSIGEQVVVAAGAVVVKDVAAGDLVVGVPAKAR